MWQVVQREGCLSQDQIKAPASVRSEIPRLWLCDCVEKNADAKQVLLKATTETEAGVRIVNSCYVSGRLRLVCWELGKECLRALRLH